MTGLFLPVCGVNLLLKIELLFTGGTCRSKLNNGRRLYKFRPGSPSHRKVKSARRLGQKKMVFPSFLYKNGVM